MILLLYLMPLSFIVIAIINSKNAENKAKHGRHPHAEMKIIVWCIILTLISIGAISYYIVTL